MRRRYFPFALMAILHLIGLLIQSPLTVWSKSMLMPLLAIGFMSAPHPGKSLKGSFRFIYGALLFSWVGDILLTRADMILFFLSGIGSFFLAQLCYCLFFFRYPVWGLRPLKEQILFVAMLLGYWIIMLWYLWPGLDATLRLPISIYSAVLVSMAGFAMAYAKKVKTPKAAQIIVPGALLFVISDSLIALDRFSPLPIWQLSFLIMLTYVLAQGLLIIGIDKVFIQAK